MARGELWEVMSALGTDSGWITATRTNPLSIQALLISFRDWWWEEGFSNLSGKAFELTITIPIPVRYVRSGLGRIKRKAAGPRHRFSNTVNTLTAVKTCCYATIRFASVALGPYSMRLCDYP